MEEIFREEVENTINLVMGCERFKSWEMSRGWGKHRVCMKNYRAKTWEMRVEGVAWDFWWVK